MIHGPSQETELLWEGRISTQAPEIDGVTYINDFGPAEPTPGEMRMVRITDAHDYDLVGELSDPVEASIPAQRSSESPFIVLPAAHLSAGVPGTRLSSDTL